MLHGPVICALSFWRCQTMTKQRASARWMRYFKGYRHRWVGSFWCVCVCVRLRLFLDFILMYCFGFHPNTHQGGGPQTLVQVCVCVCLSSPYFRLQISSWVSDPTSAKNGPENLIGGGGQLWICLTQFLTISWPNKSGNL